MSQKNKVPYSAIEGEKQLFFARGSNIFRKGCIWTQIFGASLFLISLVKSIFINSSFYENDWKLFLFGPFLLSTGFLLIRSKSFNNLFSIKSKAFSVKRSLCLKVSFICSLSVIFLIRLIVNSVDLYKSYFFGEGGLVEWSQVLFLVFSVRIGSLIVNDLKIKNLSSKIKFIYISITLFLVLLILEELAWGQVIFSWQTPDLFNSLNAQGETTFHNFSFFQNILDISFLFISLIVFVCFFLGPSILFKLERIWKSKNNYSFDIFFPPRYSWPLFATTTLISFFVANPLFPNLIINRDQEWAELFLYIGIFISLLRTYVLLGEWTYRNQTNSSYSSY